MQPAPSDSDAAVRQEPGTSHAPDSRLQILFVMQHAGFVRPYESTLRLLAGRGHRVHIAWLGDRGAPGRHETALGRWLASDCPGVTVGRAVEPEPGPWTAFARTVRMLMDYIRYLHSRYRRALLLQTRMRDLLPPWLARLARLVRVLGDRGVDAAIALLHAAEAVVPTSERVRCFLEDSKADLVLVTPMVDFASQQVDYVKAARALGIPSAVCVASWDNLTNKGQIRVVPDRVFVWNEAQKDEAVSLHRIPPANVVVTGAQLFDHWFGRDASCSREEFCDKVGLDSGRPFVLFLGSSSWMTPGEVFFVERWIRAIRDSGHPAVSTLGILIRPHPGNPRRYLSLDLSQLENVSIWPPFIADRAEHFSEGYKGDYFDSLFHSAVAVGANTSALIEAAIVGRPVCTLRVPEFERAQSGTLHFSHLAGEGHGVLLLSEGMEEHLRDLARLVEGNGYDRERVQAFVRSFVRPHGLQSPAVPILADAIEKAACLRPEPMPSGLRRTLARAAVYPVAQASAWFVPAPRKKRDYAPLWLRLVHPLIWVWVRSAVVRGTIDDQRLRQRKRLARWRKRLGRQLRRSRSARAYLSKRVMHAHKRWRRTLVRPLRRRAARRRGRMARSLPPRRRGKP